MIERRRSLRNDPAFMLAILYTCGFLGMCFMVVLRDIPKESTGTVQQLLSIMSMIQAAIAGYFYGASKAQERNAERPASVIAQTTPVSADTVNVAATTANVTGETK